MKDFEIRKYKGCEIHIEYYGQTPTSKDGKKIYCYDQNKEKLNFGKAVSLLWKAKAVIDLHEFNRKLEQGEDIGNIKLRLGRE